MGTYVGTATILDQDVRIADVKVTLGSTDVYADKWVGVVQGLDAKDLAGREIVLHLPTGQEAKARVEIDLTRDEPVIRLVGVSPSPI